MSSQIGKEVPLWRLYVFKWLAVIQRNTGVRKSLSLNLALRGQLRGKAAVLHEDNRFGPPNVRIHIYINIHTHIHNTQPHTQGGGQVSDQVWPKVIFLFFSEYLLYKLL